MVNQENGVDLKSATQSDERKLFIETYGCQMNVADSEVVASIMKMDGYSMTDLLRTRQRRTENLWAATVFPVFKTEKEVLNCRCIGMYGRTSEGRSDPCASCRLGGRTGFLSGLAELGGSGRARRESDQRGAFYPRDL